MKIFTFLALFLFFLSSCSSMKNIDFERDNRTPRELDQEARFGRVMSTDKFFDSDFFSNSSDKVTINILFETVLEKLSFMPLNSVDSNSGVIITDWFSTDDNKKQRIKFNAKINDAMLNDESLQIKMYKQTFDGSIWNSVDADIEFVNKIKASILDEARKLQIAGEL